jgi:hypothetical protein
MTLGELRKITEGMDDATDIVVMNTFDGEVYTIDDVSVNREAPVIFVETGI